MYVSALNKYVSAEIAIETTDNDVIPPHNRRRNFSWLIRRRGLRPRLHLPSRQSPVEHMSHVTHQKQHTHAVGAEYEVRANRKQKNAASTPATKTIVFWRKVVGTSKSAGQERPPSTVFKSQHWSPFFYFHSV